MKSRILAVLAAALSVFCAISIAPPAQAAPSPGNDAGLFFAVTPSRSWDTRTMGNKQPLGPGRSLTIQVTGRNGVPSSGVSAVTINLTVASSTKQGHLTAYPSDKARPNASSINFVARDIRANTATIPVSRTGSITIYNSIGDTHVVVDVMGFYAKDNTISSTYGLGAGLVPAAVRLADSRPKNAPIEPGGYVTLTYSPASRTAPTTRAAYLNVTAPGPTGPGFLAVSGTAAPTGASSLNFRGGEIAVANTVAVPLTRQADNSLTFVIRNHSKTPQHYVVDVLGAFDTDLYDTKYVPYGPTRVMDTRFGIGVAKARISGNRTINLPAALKGPNTYAIVGNAALVYPSDGTFLRIWDGDGAPPDISTVNANAHQIIANGTLGATNFTTGNVTAYNRKGSTDAILDITGMFQFDGLSTVALMKQKEASLATTGAAAHRLNATR